MIEYVKTGKPILVMGYDWERYGKEDLPLDEQKRQRETGIDGLKIVCSIHRKLRKPFTLFILGKMLERPKILEALLTELGSEVLRDLMDTEQHGYSHTEFKKLPDRTPLTLDQIRWEVSYARDLIRTHLKTDSFGIRVPQGHYQGLRDSYEILEILYDEGIRFVSSDLRNEDEEFPSGWYDRDGSFRQPYFYDKQKMKDLVEIPTQGWNDNALKGMSRTTIVRKHTLEEEVEIHKENIDFVVEHILCYAPLFHPWAIAMTDEKGYVVEQLLQYAEKKGVEVMSYSTLYSYVIQKGHRERE